MKLNPPETAPRDGTPILACFYLSNSLLYAYWSKSQDSWLAAYIGARDFDTHYYDTDEMLGWLPMPKADDKGNVTCTSK